MAGLRSLLSVDRLLQVEDVQDWILLYGRPLTVEAVRICLERVREQYKTVRRIPNLDELLIQIHNRLEIWTQPTLIPVINASGVILHTNLGRAPLSQEAIQAAQAVAAGFSNLEYDLDKGQRGSRSVHAQALLVHLTGAQAGLVVNNNAAAVLLALTVLARRRSVVIARSQLVEIGGGFRVPDVMKQSGARLIEVGTTNRVHLSDYEQALIEKPALFYTLTVPISRSLVLPASQPSTKWLLSPTVLGLHWLMTLDLAHYWIPGNLASHTNQWSRSH